MNDFKKGTPAFGLFLGILFLLIGILVMSIGFWKTLLLGVLFCAGYFIGSVNNKAGFFKDTMNKIVPEKKEETIDFRKEVEKEQASEYAGESDDAAEESYPADNAETVDFRKEIEAEQAAMFPSGDNTLENKENHGVEE